MRAKKYKRNFLDEKKDHMKANEAWDRALDKVKEYEEYRMICKDGWCMQKLGEASRNLKDLRDEIRYWEDFAMEQTHIEVAFKEKEMKLIRSIEAIREKSNKHMENHSDAEDKYERLLAGVKKLAPKTLTLKKYIVDYKNIVDQYKQREAQGHAANQK
jgi:hypothetical protein